MSDPADTLVACELCETLIEGTIEHVVFGLSMLCKRTICAECEYRESFRTSRLVKIKPYRDPFPRPTKDDKMPADLRAEVKKRLDAHKAKHGH